MNSRYTYGADKINFRFFGLPDTKFIIGSFCSISEGLQVFLGGNHRVDRITTYPFGHIYQDIFPWNGEGHPTTKGDIIIGNDVWIGSNCTILSGVNIGDGAVVGACSVVTKNVPPYTIVAGNPARIKRKRFSDSQIERLLKNPWWNLSDEKIKKLLPLLCSSNIEEFIIALENTNSNEELK